MNSKGSALIEREVLLKDIEQVYVDHYKNSNNQAVHDFFKAVCRRVRKASPPEIIWLDAGKNIHGRKRTKCRLCGVNFIDGGLFCRFCGAPAKQ